MNSPRGERGCSQSSWGCRTLSPTLASVLICFVSVSDRFSLCGSKMAPVVLSLCHSCSSWSYRHKENLPDWLSLGHKSDKLSWSSSSAPTQTKWIESISFLFWSGCRSWGGGEYDFPVKKRNSICPLYLSTHIFFFIHYAEMPTGNLSDIEAPRIGLIEMRKIKDKDSWPSEQRWQKVFPKWHSGNNRNKRTTTALNLNLTFFSVSKSLGSWPRMFPQI